MGNNDVGRVTMRSIAKAAGVHHTTVSRTLAQPPSSSDSAAAQNVRRIAQELGYVPDLWAASLRSRRTQMVGVIVPHLTDVVMASIFEAVRGRASDCGYLAVSSFSRDDLAEQAAVANELLARRADGILLGDVHLRDPLLDVLSKQDVKFVLFARRSEDYPHIGWDDELGGYLVGSHFTNLGHTRIGIVAGPSHASTSVDRVQGFRRALTEAGVDLPADMVVEGGFDVTGGRYAATQLLEGPKPPTAIFAVNDYAAIGVMGVLRSAGKEPGRDVAVAGYNDISIAQDLTIPLTSVSVPTRELGTTAFDMLLQRIEGRSVRSRLLAPRLVARASSLGNGAL